MFVIAQLAFMLSGPTYMIAEADVLNFGDFTESTAFTGRRILFLNETDLLLLKFRISSSLSPHRLLCTADYFEAKDGSSDQ